LKIVYYTSGITGSGRVVTGISIGNAFRRKGIPCKYIIVSGSDFSFLSSDFTHVKIPLEEENSLSEQNYKSSILLRTLTELKPDILLVDLLWFSLYHLIRELPCKKIFLCRQVDDSYFSINLKGESLNFRSADYDLLIATEPFTSSIPMQFINPITIRNRDEILPREEALKRLGVSEDRPVCLFAYNGEPGEFEKIKKKYSYLDDSENQMLYSTNYSDKSFFPIVDYFNAIDFLVSGAGYNAFWEIIYFNKEAIFEPVKRNFENQFWRIQNCQEYYFEENGADQLVDIIMNL
jgi:hypothetical protein